MSPLRRARIAHLWSQERLAREAGISNVTVSLIERGIRRPALITQEKLAQALGVDREELFPAEEAAAAAAS